MAAIDPQAAAVRWQFVHVPDAQAGRGEDALHRAERQIREVLVVHGVELRVAHKLQQVRELQRYYAFGLEQRRQPSGEIVNVRHVGVDIVAGNQVRVAALRRKPARQRLAKELAKHRDAQRLGRISGAGGRLDAQAGHARIYKVAQQIAVIGGHLHHVAMRPQPEALGDLLGVGTRMRQPAARGAGKVGVIGTEQLVSLCVVLGLHQPALVAHLDPQRVVLFGAGEVCGCQVGIGRRRKAQVEKSAAQRGVAVAAVHVLPLDGRSSAQKILRAAAFSASARRVVSNAIVK